MYKILRDWKTPNTYGANFASLTAACGVYVIVMTKMESFYTHKAESEIIYIGSSTNLKSRISSHEVVKVLRAMFTYTYHISVHFKECHDFRRYEKELIKHFRPRINQINN